MTSRLFTEEELSNFVYENAVYHDHDEVYKNYQYMTTIIRVDDKFYLVNWQKDIGEWGDDIFHELECREMVKSPFSYELTNNWIPAGQEEKERDYTSDVESLEVLGLKNVMEDTLDSVTMEELDSMSSTLEKIMGLEVIDALNARRIAALQLVEDIRKLKS